MAKQRKKIQEPGLWYWTWRRLSSESVFWWSGPGRHTSASQGRFYGSFAVILRVQFEGCAAEPLQTITAILPGSKWSCLPLRIVLQDALSEVTKFYPPMKFRVFVDDITALVKGRKEVAEMAKKVIMKLKEEVEKKKGLKLSVTESGKEGKNKMIASCGFLEDELRQCSKAEGVTLAHSVETVGVDLRTRAKKLGATEEAKRSTK